VCSSFPPVFYTLKDHYRSCHSSCVLFLSTPCRSVAEKRKARSGESGLGGPQEPPEILLEKLGFPRKKQFQKVCGLECLWFLCLQCHTSEVQSWVVQAG
jgi:hypothetical protein